MALLQMALQGRVSVVAHLRIGKRVSSPYLKSIKLRFNLHQFAKLGGEAMAYLIQLVLFFGPVLAEIGIFILAIWTNQPIFSLLAFIPSVLGVSFLGSHIIASPYYDDCDEDYIHPMDLFLVKAHSLAFTAATLVLIYLPIGLLPWPDNAKVFLYVCIVSVGTVVLDRLKPKASDFIFLAISTTVAIRALYLAQILGSVGLSLADYLSIPLPLESQSVVAGVLIGVMTRTLLLDSEVLPDALRVKRKKEGVPKS